MTLNNRLYSLRFFFSYSSFPFHLFTPHINGKKNCAECAAHSDCLSARVSQEEMDDPILPRAKGKTQSSYYIYNAKKSPQKIPYHIKR